MRNIQITLKKKMAARNDRNCDRDDKSKAVVTFDLENVLSCPKAEVSSFYYQSKLSVYNLTAHFSLTGQIYCALWSEIIMGRKGNDIASALVKILYQIITDHPDVKELILWNDSCVPQNRNSVITYALGYFMTQTAVEKITMKYSAPGHSCVQEIDSVHSSIERVLSKVEYYSPVSLLRILIMVNRRKPFKIIQMKRSDFFDYQVMASTLYDYSNVPYTKTSVLEIQKGALTVNFKKYNDDTNYINIDIKKQTRTAKQLTHPVFPNPKPCEIKINLSANKKGAIKKMLPYMPKQDQEYYIAVIPELLASKRSTFGTEHINKKAKASTPKLLT